jgi:hypothetical protein
MCSELSKPFVTSLQKGGTPSRQERKEQQMKGESFAPLRLCVSACDFGLFSVNSFV